MQSLFYLEIIKVWSRNRIRLPNWNLNFYPFEDITNHFKLDLALNS